MYILLLFISIYCPISSIGEYSFVPCVDMLEDIIVHHAQSDRRGRIKHCYCHYICPEYMWKWEGRGGDMKVSRNGASFAK